MLSRRHRRFFLGDVEEKVQGDYHHVREVAFKTISETLTARVDVILLADGWDRNVPVLLFSLY